MNSTDINRLPGEFEPQSALMVAWPHRDTDWLPILSEIRDEIHQLIEATLAYQPVIMLVDPDDSDPLPETLLRHTNIHITRLPFDDTWCRDFGPIGLLSGEGLKLLDFKFTAWGKAYRNTEDNQVIHRLCQLPNLERWIGPFKRVPIDFILEGGAIESNGHGTVMINWFCLETRHPKLSRQEISEALKLFLHAQSVIGIDLPPHPGDDTDGHIDTLARFIDPTSVVFQTLHDDGANEALLEQLTRLRVIDPNGELVRPELIALPATSRINEFPMNYVNFVLLNDACLIPAYGMASDRLAQDIMEAAMPQRRIIPVPSTNLIRQFGGPHCATMHIPKSPGYTDFFLRQIDHQDQ